ncbi:peptidoglycan DD-metalloendopeptidase family protein [Litorisediminicola beolgyonensis]|uniref:Peptidoglycan DD-metalloendopeptidase family protein n=1 Tax=Litorisediminicola beolgyonensis TaxID=1173614 RepID=A0ABW3ZE36_9RHOB
MHSPLTRHGPFPSRRTARLGVLLLGTAALAACSGPLDLDLRGRMGGTVDTAGAAVSATETRPAPDARGVLSYPNYQVVVARRGDTVGEVASRIGLNADELARYNGMSASDPLRGGEVLALPSRVAEPSPATGAASTGPIRPAGQIDISTLASGAIARAPETAATPAPSPQGGSGVEPIRHQVRRGETAFTIARLYNVSPSALAQWNGLDANFTVREGQFLLIPVTVQSAAAPVVSETRVPTPGTGSPTPLPPSATTPLPAAVPPPVRTAEAPTPAPAASTTTTAAAPTPAAAPAPKPEIGPVTKPATTSSAAMTMPVQGSIIREYARGRNDGIDIAAPAGTAVKAAASGSVAAITTNTDGIPIVVIKHPDNLLTVYTHLDGLSVKKGDAVSRGQTIGKVRAGDPARVHFEVRDGFDSVDPMAYLR